MSTPSLRLLIVEDRETDALLVVRALRRVGYTLKWERVEDEASLRAALAEGLWDVIISDWSMPHFSALAALAVVKDFGLDVPFIIASGTVDEDTAVSGLRAGAHDFVVKGRLARLGPAIERELREVSVRTSQRQAEQDLRASDARYRLLFDNSPLPMWVFDIESLAFVAVNEAAVRHYGYTREEFARLTIADIRAPEEVPLLRQELARGPSDYGGRIWKHRKKDGSGILVEIKSHSFQFEGKAVRLVLANDVTERERAQQNLRKAEEQLRHAQKMEAVGRLAGGIAHDFNNILSVILSYSELIGSALKDADPIRDDLDEIRKAGLRAAELTRQLLMFSRHHVPEPKVLDLNKTLQGIEKMLRRLLGEDVQLALLTGRTGGRIHADPGQLEQVIMNLVVNARDAMPKGGTVSLETADVELDAEYVAEHLGATPGRYVMLAVSDTGVGMDAATRARIFEPFFTTKEIGKGTGLGLSTAFGIVKQSGGHIGVYSEPGVGTTFKVYFPCTDRAASVVQSVPPSPIIRRGFETILLVEDEEQVRALALTILRRNGYNVLEAQNGGEAFLVCEKFTSTIHLLLTDVVMPRMSGRELAERLAPMRPEMRVLYTSGYTDDAIVHHGVLEAGVSYLQKPITPDSLLLKVREVLDVRRTPTPK